MAEPLYLDDFGQVFKESTLHAIFMMLVTDETYPDDLLEYFWPYLDDLPEYFWPYLPLKIWSE